MKRHAQPVPSEELERTWRQRGYRLVAGLDEVGRGAWAGPLVMGAVILPPDVQMRGLRDSKLLNPAQRESLALRIKQIAITWSLGIVTVPELNEFGLAASLHLAAQRAIAGLEPQADAVLFDGKSRVRGIELPQETIVRGDQLVRAIAAASIVAKVARDEMMCELHSFSADEGRYRFDRNKGYPSLIHRIALETYGISDQHRQCFAPIKELMKTSYQQDLFDTQSVK